jgi:hypothetical protein
MVDPLPAYGTTRERAASVSFADIEAAARWLMASGRYPSVAGIRKELKRGSTTTIAEAMQRFWQNQAALNRGDPVALTDLPPELAEAARAQWEKALRLAQQTARQDTTEAAARLAELERIAEERTRSTDLREAQWELAARIRERALADAREQVNTLFKQLTADRAELRMREARITSLEALVDDYRRQLATVVTRAVAKSQALVERKPPQRVPPKARRRTVGKPAARRIKHKARGRKQRKTRR